MLDQAADGFPVTDVGPRAEPSSGRRRENQPAVRGRWAAVGLLSAALVVVAVYPGLPAGLANWDVIVKLQVAENILAGAGPVLTEQTPDDLLYVMRGVDGRNYAGYPPAAYLVQIPTLFLAGLGVEREGLAPLLLLALLAWVLVGWGRRSGASYAGAAAGAMLVCLGTAWWHMSAAGHDNVVEALALAMLLCAYAGRGKRRDWFAAGLALAFAIDVRYGAAVLAVPAAVLLAAELRARGWRTAWRIAIAFGAGVLPGLAIDLWWNFRRFGSPFTFAAGLLPGALAMTVEPFSRTHWEGMAGLLFSPGKGFLWYAPPLILVLALFGPLWRRSRSSKGEFVAAGAYLLAAVVLFGRLTCWHGDWAWGPRYVAPVYVMAAPLGWWGCERLASGGRGWKLGGALAFVVAISIQIAPIVGFPVVCQMRHVLQLAASGRIATPNISQAPLPADNRVLYFQPANTMPVTLVECLASRLANPAWRGRLLGSAAVASLAPLLALIAVAAASRIGRRATAPP